jgi:hypothetical protein
MKRPAFVAAGMLVAASSLSLLFTGSGGVSEAQDRQPPARQGGAAPGGAAPGGVMGGMGMRRPMGMMGQGSLVAHGGHLFVLMGPTLYKIDPNSMEVVKKLEIINIEEMRRARRPEEGGRARPEGGRRDRPAER